MILSPGNRLGPYEVLGTLGVGGMGEVYKARDSRLDRTVALKLLPAHVSGDPGRCARFEREARALAALNHPNIVTVYSVEQVDAWRFLTLEFVEGKTLAQMIPAAGMALSPLLAVAVPLADALETAHARGIVHRDLKPANVMVSNEGRLKVLDFGLARLAGAAEGESRGEETLAGEGATLDLLTHVGQVVGTCSYMSPEQARGLVVDARSDLFSFGTMLFEMATGRRPFQGATDLDVLVAITRDQPPGVRELCPALPQAYDELVARCLEKDRNRRVQTAREVCGELEAIRKAGSGSLASPVAAPAERSPRDRRVAVLPFANMSADAEQEYFCDGMAEDVINALAHVEGLQVAARTSAFAFKGQKRDVREIGRLLDVGSVLEGSVRRAGTRLRITAQLVRVADGMHLWSERFDRQLDDVFAIQDEISLAIVDRLKVQLLAGEGSRIVRRHTVNPEAHDLYLRGRFLFARRSKDDIARAMSYYEQAKALDPEYALPYVGLADALLVLTQWAWMRPTDACPRAGAELRQALLLDPDLAEAHASLGYLATIYEWDWRQAQENFARAIALNPRYPLARHWHAILLAIRERFDEALSESRLYVTLEPLSPIANTHLGQILYHARRIPEAIAQLKKALELDPHMLQAHTWLAASNLAAGRIDDVLEAANRMWRTLPLAGGFAVLALAAAGRQDEAREWRDRLLQQAEKPQGHPGFRGAWGHAALDEQEAAVAAIERAFQERDPVLPYMKLLSFGAKWERVLADPRVRAVARRMGLPD